MRKASTKDIFRTIWKEKKRFFSIMMITVLGVTLMTGLEAGCRDLKISADRFYDSQNLFDISIMSTLGLTEEDVKVIGAMEGVKKAEGAFSEVVHTKRGERNQTAEVKVFTKEGVNVPYVVEGRLPESGEEIAVSENYLKETGKKIGESLRIEEIKEEETEDTKEEKILEESEKSKPVKAVEGEKFSLDVEDQVEMEEEETENFPNTGFTIVGTVIDVMDINNAEGSAAFRATPNADYTFFVTKDAVESDVYTAVYVTLEGTRELLCYTEEYEVFVEEFLEKIEAEIMQQREEARYLEITQKAYDKISDKEEEMQDAFREIEDEFEDARKELSDGWEEISDGRRELAEKEQEAKEQIADAKVELEEAYQKLSNAWLQLNDAEKQLNIGLAQLEEGKETLRQKEKEAKVQMEEAENLLKSKKASNHTSLEQLNANLAQIRTAFVGQDNRDAWTERIDNISLPGGTQVSTSVESAWNTYVEATKQVVLPVIAGGMSGENTISEEEMQLAVSQAIQNAYTSNAEYGMAGAVLKSVLAAVSGSLPAGAGVGISEDSILSLGMGIATCQAADMVLENAMAEFEQQKESALDQIEAAWGQLQEGERELEEGRGQLSAGRAEVIDNYEKWQDGVQELEEKEQEALQEISEAKKELAEAEQELVDGNRELEEHETAYLENREEAEEKIEEEKQKVSEMDMTKWYVQDRTSLSGYVNVDSDTACIESLATVFTIVFFIVAILISLTTVTRMVEEERGLIGTYKALGFTDREIRRKYLLYALGASMLGAALGDVGGFVVLPEILFVFFRVMYLFPVYVLRFDMAKGTISGILFIFGIAGAAVAACYSELKHVPAHLMRPKAPGKGSRVFLEYIKPLWRRMSFLNKVTARNLFRYKKRMFMTLFGIMGCTALLVFGLAIKDSVAELMPLQYENVYGYDLLAATSAEENEKLLSYMEKNDEVSSYLNLQVESVKIKNLKGDNEKVQLMIFPSDGDIRKYFTLTNEKKEAITIGESGIYLTENASRILGIGVGDTAYIQKVDLTQKEVKVTALIKNYLGNNIYMSENAYKEIFGEYEPNGVLVNFSEKCKDQIAFSDKLAEEDWILSSVSTQDLKDNFAKAFTLINLVVYVVLVLAACLAFVVLFTLASINISERERELATIKVLGFYDKEVHAYVNKETLILTAIGILIGLPVGAGLSSMLTDILNMPSIYFAVTIYNKSYFCAAGIAFLFAFIVQFLTDRTLNGIDPVEALKSVE